MAVTVEIVTEAPRTGEPVEFHLKALDPDRSDRDCDGVDYGDPAGPPWCVGGIPSCAPTATPYGPWSPPEKHPSRYDRTYTWTYTHRGTYTATFSVRNTRGCDTSSSAYYSEGTAKVTVTVN
jgi:hypothetical protein